jgi:integrase/recombinase XerD
MGCSKLTKHYFYCQKGLSEKLVRKFIERKPNWHQGTQEHHVHAIRLFALYLLRHDVPAFLVDYTSVTDLHEDYKPYIFTHKEINRIFEQSDSIRPNGKKSHIFYPVLLRVQYACGLRISETLGLRMSDVDLKEKIFHIKDAKNHKDREVPFGDSVGEYLTWYFLKIHQTYRADDYFFMNHWGNRHYSLCTVSSYFRKILFLCRIPHGGRKNGGPHLHCLRHTFCCHSLEKMLREGTAHQAALPILMTYLGHSSLSATGYYLRLTAEAFPDLQDKINHLYGGIIPDLKVRLDYEDD